MGETKSRVTRKTNVYEVRRPGWEDYFELHVSPSLRTMRDEVRRVFKSWGAKEPEDLHKTEGLCHPVLGVEGPFAYMFLAKGSLGVGIVAHECLHVAMAHERFVLRFGMGYGDGFSGLEDEERLAYYLTWVVREVYKIIYDGGYEMPGEGVRHDKTR